MATGLVERQARISLRLHRQLAGGVRPAHRGQCVRLAREVAAVFGAVAVAASGSSLEPPIDKAYGNPCSRDVDAFRAGNLYRLEKSYRRRPCTRTRLDHR